MVVSVDNFCLFTTTIYLHFVPDSEVTIIVIIFSPVTNSFGFSIFTLDLGLFAIASIFKLLTVPFMVISYLKISLLKSVYTKYILSIDSKQEIQEIDNMILINDTDSLLISDNDYLQY